MSEVLTVALMGLGFIALGILVARQPLREVAEEVFWFFVALALFIPLAASMFFAAYTLLPFAIAFLIFLMRNRKIRHAHVRDLPSRDPGLAGDPRPE